MPRRTAVAADSGGQRAPEQDPAPGGGPGIAATPAGDPLLAAKFEIPPAPRTLVRRRRLADRLDGCAGAPLTLVTGPAGAGKTTLVATWAATASSPGPVVWLTTEQEENGPGPFWAYVIGAFRHCGVPLPDVPPPATGDGVGHATLVRLAWALTRLPRPVVLVLDGLEQLTDRRITDGLDFVLGHAAGRLRLVVTSRVEPLLPLHRYRTQGLIEEIRGADLAFTGVEARRLLERHGLKPSEQSTTALVERTQGWAAGLRLCALAMRRSDDPEGFARSFAASRQAVADYLLAEVLRAHPAPTQELLLRTSILDRITPSLADELTGRSDASRILTSLAHANSLVEPTRDGLGYDCHPLFAAVLRAHLRIRHPGLEPELHRRAARWYAEHGGSTRALRHAGAAGDWGHAAGLVVDRLAVGRLLTGGNDDRLVRLFDAMPDEFPAPAAALVAAACSLARHDRPGCRARLARAQALFDAAADPPSAAARAEHALLRLLSGDAAQTPETSAARTSGLLDRVPAHLLAEHPEAESLRLLGLAVRLLGEDRTDEAEAAFRDAAASCTAPVTDGLRRECLARLALTESLRGDLRRAEEHALRANAADGAHRTPARRGAAALAMAVLATERADFADARRHLHPACEEEAVRLDPCLAAESAVVRSRLGLHDGSPQQALAVLDAATGDGRAGPSLERYPRRTLERLAIARSAAHLARCDHEQALSALDVAEPSDGAVAVALARAHCAAGDPARARRLLAAAGRHGTGPAGHVRSRLVLARAALLAGDRAAADGWVAQALETARPELLRLPFVEEGPWLRRLLERRTDLARSHGWLSPERDGTDGAGSVPAPAEPLTGRERDVLRCASRMLSTAEIADELGLSANTVKTHLRSIFRKLSVSRRGEAVRRAVRLGVL
ncbi:LuxR C-terminal-related transcriptional regulator [Streptomyces meridianus]|uniref:LuxR C-terminal-related transcriptional regulator n=1 Tax=Streptomyces meridianus TaxID=2938945 RepID=A0ABT0XBC3_9ACTN|nr:LuxR C-terminal-related transcriptional regulator [Streptomyces meridianus]MCM2579801.1 LuxR C-terminal-related transcriptional regulator [Streptomyces meridianus]